MRSLLLLTALGVLAYVVYRARYLFAPRERMALFVVAALSALALTFALYPSDPQDWTWAGFVLYLAVPRLEPLAILGNLLTGGTLFALATLGVYWANRSR